MAKIQMVKMVKALPEKEKTLAINASKTVNFSKHERKEN